MTKKILTITGMTLCTFYGVLSWAILVHSEPPAPENSPQAKYCNSLTTSNKNAPEKEYDLCCIDYHDAMDAVERDWDNSLQSLIDQEIAASEMVADAYESLRTYNCWLEYICRAVEFSGHAPIESVEPGENGVSTGLTSTHLGVVPGCQPPEAMKMETEYNTFVDVMKTIPLIGYPVENYEGYFTATKMNFFPRCMTDSNNNESPDLVLISKNYTDCKAALELRFGCPPGVDKEICTATSSAFAKVDNILKKTNADQKARALESKLADIVPQLQVMETHVDYASNFLQQLNTRLKCFAAKCT